MPWLDNQHLPPHENALPPQGGAGGLRPQDGGRDVLLTGMPNASNYRGSRVCDGSPFTNGSTSSPPPPTPGLDADGRARRARGYHLRTGHRGLIGDVHDSVACCGLGLLPEQAGGDGYARLSMRHCEGLADISQTTRCASVWACPVCAPRIASRRARVLQPQVVSMMAAGWSAHLVTMTLRHDVQHEPDALFEALRLAWARTTSGKAWRSLRSKGGVEYVRGYDVTWSPRAGWHPHLHLSLYLGPEHDDPDAVCRWLLDRWMSSLARLGWQSLPQAQDAQRCYDPQKAARYSVTPAAVYESLALAMKRSRGAGSGATPFEILARAVDGAQADFPYRLSQPHARQLWRDYVAATKGRRQVNASRGLSLASDEELVAPDDDLVDELALLGSRTVGELDRTRKLSRLLDAVESAAGDELAVRYRALEVLSELTAKDWSIPYFDQAPPDIPEEDEIDLAVDATEALKLSRVPISPFLVRPGVAGGHCLPG